ncbi:hypothetical protein BCR36DRAFT_346553, partial [Piromyces finnis]
MTISNSNFSNNYCKSNGGAICIDNISNLYVNLKSNLFENNQAINGGALYFGDKIGNNLNIDPYINIENNTFKRNLAENFGGAIYSKYTQMELAVFKKNEITFNEAGIMGGGIYIENSVNKNLMNLNDSIIENNTVNSYINNFTSKPSYILLNTTLNDNISIITGDYFPLNFTLFDEFDNLIEDITKYYSSMTLKVSMIEKENNMKNLDKISFKMMGNIGSFIKGRCELTNLRIFANPNTYILKFSIENYNNDININVNNVEIEVKGCNKDQIKMHNKNILYCENPICKSTCPTNSTATCKPYYEESINDRNLNRCECLQGWGGEYCENRVFLDFSILKNNISSIFILISFIILVYVLFIILNRKQNIIKDSGFYKILIFCTGLFFFFFSLLFSTYTNYFECSLNFFFKHVGISLMLVIYYIFNSIGVELGILNEKDEKFKFLSTDTLSDSIRGSKTNLNEYSKSSGNQFSIFSSKTNLAFKSNPLLYEEIHPTITNNLDNNNTDSIINKKYETEIKEKVKSEKRSIDDLNSEYSSSSLILNISKSNGNINEKYTEKTSNQKNKNKALIKSVKNAHVMFLEILIFYPIFFIVIIITIGIYKLKDVSYTE